MSSVRIQQVPRQEFLKIQPQMLQKDFYLSMLDLEERVNNAKTVTLERINHLIDKYAACVEYFDSVSNPIKIYFLEKIQITLANTRYLNILINSTEQNNIQSHFQSSNTNNTICSKNQNNFQQFMQEIETPFQHYTQVKDAQDQINDSLESKKMIFQETQKNKLFIKGLADDILYDQIDTQATERTLDQENLGGAEIIDDTCNQGLTQLLKNEINSHQNNIQRQYYHHRNQFSGDFSDYASYNNSIVMIDSKTQSIINHLNQDLFSPKNIEEVYDDQKKKIERAKRVELYMKVHAHQNKQVDEAQSINHIISNYEQSFKQNDDLIRNDIQNQIDQINQKISKKKKKNYIFEINKNTSDCKSPTESHTSTE
ncbi:hypothetical protein TTHERM_01164100 (macronuclear) [Tetrahymena thermophila SB210]|uniref:Uncharacterized protein n=1 Tax=Tetrahymena thermophila (strain SB210) TaxID=312017 RepID=Q22AS8_TETTS|nr:hypothetical protein TTHERM_01164100 [Tetrahymena thermophila SB210]EAR82390.2 hypothetical protein TTHERM_01164100 [Tetrahymena thermophila SB210]|eukprot:XP_001030053.2 hypothetical protein TTHERM_01164100 [Tetrahymena thermophila SB210]